jgi:hypothetical protein
MKIERHKAAARGVNQLMYVGDDQATEQASGSLPMVAKVALVAVAGWLIFGGGR